MITAISLSQIFVTDQDEALRFYVEKLGLEVKQDIDLGFMRWLTVVVPGQPEREILLERPGPPAMNEATAAQVRDSLTRGAAGGWIGFQTDDIHATYNDLRAKGVEITQEPVDQFYGTDIGARDPFGNNIRILQPKPFDPADAKM